MNTQERIGSDINGVRSDVGALKNDLGSKYNQIKEQVKETAENVGQQAYDSAKSTLNDIRSEGKALSDQVCSQTSRSIETARSYVRENPMRSLAAAVCAGVLIGYLRKRA